MKLLENNLQNEILIKDLKFTEENLKWFNEIHVTEKKCEWKVNL